MAFSVAAPQAWNRLPTDLKTLRSTPAFKRSLKTFCSGRHTMFDFSAFTYRFYPQTVPVLSFYSVPDIVMRRRSICRRRTIVVFVFVFSTVKYQEVLETDSLRGSLELDFLNVLPCLGHEV